MNPLFLLFIPAALFGVSVYNENDEARQKEKQRIADLERRIGELEKKTEISYGRK